MTDQITIQIPNDRCDKQLTNTVTFLENLQGIAQSEPITNKIKIDLRNDIPEPVLILGDNLFYGYGHIIEILLEYSKRVSKIKQTTKYEQFTKNRVKKRDQDEYFQNILNTGDEKSREGLDSGSISKTIGEVIESRSLVSGQKSQQRRQPSLQNQSQPQQSQQQQKQQIEQIKKSVKKNVDIDEIVKRRIAQMGPE